MQYTREDVKKDDMRLRKVKETEEKGKGDGR
jgi:hypothetical protein